MAQRPRRLVTVALTLLAATACTHRAPAGGPLASGPSGTPSGPSGSASGAATPAGTASGGPSGPATGPASPGTSGAASGRPGTSGTPSATPGLAVTLQVRSLCVQPGGTQTADVTTRPGADVLVNTIYSDSKEGTTHGGLGTGKAGASGRYTYTWTVRLGTPEGKARTLARAAKDGVRGDAFARFLVSLHCGPGTSRGARP